MKSSAASDPARSTSDRKLRKVLPVSLREAGFSEAWLQSQIAKDTSLLGLGELHLIQREKTQASGGRMDFLMSDPESETRYEIEVMLGAVDERHIIHTIEYWDVERQRYPLHEHRAVIVAETITARFFNVIRLLNRAVPIIAIQLSAFIIDDSIVLHFTRVLDTYEFADEDDDGGPKADRTYWEKRASKESIEVLDSLIALVGSHGQEHVTYNQGHIALGTSGTNFCWVHPRTKMPHCNVHMKVQPESREENIASLDEVGIEASNKGRDGIKFRLSKKHLADGKDVVKRLIAVAESNSRSMGGTA